MTSLTGVFKLMLFRSRTILPNSMTVCSVAIRSSQAGFNLASSYMGSIT
jgi:hypothetical protein